MRPGCIKRSRPMGGIRSCESKRLSRFGQRGKKRMPSIAGREWKGRGEWSEKGDRMHGTVLVRWEEGYEEAICVVSDLPQDQAKTAWYQMRFWIEDEYKDGKRGWFHWEQTKMTNPQRASRL